MKFYWATEARPFLIETQGTDDNATDILWTGHPYLTLEDAQASCEFVTSWCEHSNAGVGTGRQWEGSNGDTDFLIREYEIGNAAEAIVPLSRGADGELGVDTA